MVVDGTAPITIKTLAEPHAFIVAIQQLDAKTGQWYLIYDSTGVGTPVQGQCTAGATCWINLRLQNNGTLAGIVYIKITRTDTGAVILNRNYSLGINAYVDVTDISFVMPNVDLSLMFEIGH